ncbi:rhodanese-like domain-containing protein [Fredinandcohnia sp. 179-A 10B2 NHS]|uniref:rhodanese-like domain-containing protein n=1 Tax=Fredinandcohnia sp. 179-A 10B2 NHS TaxID=3235176 RepID=UPI0039A1356E
MDTITVVQIGLVILFIILTYDRFKPVKNFEQLSETEIKERLKKSKDAVLIDVRNQYEYETNHIIGAINLPLPQIRRKKVNVPADKEIILYCQTGIRSKQAARILRKRYKNLPLAHLNGGLYSWKSETGKSTKKN